MPARNKGTRVLLNPRADANQLLTPVVPLDGNAVADRAQDRVLYLEHLRGGTSAYGDRYSPRTIEGYLIAVDNLEDWCQRTGRLEGYQQLDVTALNAYFADYRKTHTQGGVNTAQRRLRVFYGWLAGEYADEGIRNPFDSPKLARYAKSQPAPRAYGSTFVQALIHHCQGSDFEAVRDTAIVRLLDTGIRRGELAALWVDDVDLGNRIIRVAALKGTRRDAPVLRIDGGVEMRVGRIVPIGEETAAALARWLRMRSRHKLVKDRTRGPLWYSTRGRGRLKGNGIWRMLKRRAEQAGYDPAMVTAHGFRHTRAHELMRSGTSDGNVMAVMGWRDRAMLDGYAANLAQQRAIEAVREAGLVR